MRLLCLGAGAVGGYFCGRLAQAGEPVTFLVREGRKRQLEESGLRIESPHGNASLPVETLTQREIDAPFDLVVLTCKAYDLDPAIEAIRPAMGPASAVLPLLNGLSHMERLNDEFGRERVLGGVAKIASTLTGEGTIWHLNDWATIVFGEQDGRMSERVQALKAAFDKTSISASAVPDIRRAMWEKLVHLATVAGMTCLMRANVGEIARTRDGAEIVARFLEANAAISAREGYPVSEEFLSEYRALFADRAAPYSASMLRDIERKGPVEADHVIGFMLDRAQAHGLDDSLHRIAYAHLQAYEQRRAAGRL